MKKVLALGLLFPKKTDLQLLVETTSTEIFEGNNKEFYKHGLYSPLIYGVIGSDERYQQFSYKHLGLKIIHPRIYKHLLTLNRDFEKIIKGKKFVLFNPKTKVFEESDIESGYTGYSYFIKHVMEVALVKNDSDSRNEKINYIDKYRKTGSMFIEYLYILPAGLREYILSSSGRDEEDEVNILYRNVIRFSNMVINSNVDADSVDLIDPTITRLQVAVVEVYDYIIDLMDGKKKRIRGSWLDRTIDGGTRNVLSSIPIVIDDLDDTSRHVGFNDTVFGLYQIIMSTNRIMIYHLQKSILESILDSEARTIKVFDTKTLKQKIVPIKRNEFDLWGSIDGITDVMSKLLNDDNKNRPIIISGGYLGLVEVNGEERNVYINTPPDGKELTPITYGELFTIIVYMVIPNIRNTVTRYPAITEGGTYLSNIKLFTTIDSDKGEVTIVSDIQEIKISIPWYPRPGLSWINTVGPHYTKLEELNADFDGDKGNMQIITSEEAVQNVDELFDDLSMYIKPDGTPTNNISDSISELVVATLTKRN